MKFKMYGNVVFIAYIINLIQSNNLDIQHWALWGMGCQGHVEKFVKLRP